MFRQVMVHLSAGILYSYKKGGTRDHKSYHTLQDKSVQRCQKPVQQYLLNCNCSHKCPQERSEPSKLCNVLQYSKRKSSKTHYWVKRTRDQICVYAFILNCNKLYIIYIHTILYIQHIYIYICIYCQEEDVKGCVKLMSLETLQGTEKGLGWQGGQYRWT